MNDGSGGGGGSRSGLSDYIDPDNPSLLGKVDFAGMVRDWFRSIVLLISLSWASVVVGLGRAFTSVIDAGRNGLLAIYTELLTGPASAQKAAAETAGSELEVFGIFALPVSVAVALASVLAFVVVTYIFTGGELV